MINTIDHIINIDLANKINMNQSINIKQNDTNSHEFIINIFNNSVVYDLTGTTSRIYFQKSDGTKVFLDCALDVALTGKLSCLLTTQALSCAGLVASEITIYGTAGEILTSVTFNFIVSEVIRDDVAIESTSEFTALTTALNSIEEALVSVPTIEALKIELDNDIITGDALDTALKGDITTGNVLDTSLKADIATGNPLDASLKADISTGNPLDISLKADIATGDPLDVALKDDIAIGNPLDILLKDDIAAGNITDTNIKDSTIIGDATDADLKADIIIAGQNEFATEITNARGGEINLDTRLDKVDTSLADNTQEHLDIVAQIEGISLIDSAVAITDANSLFTATKLDGALNELFTFANSGKTAVASAITAKGVTASSADTFPTLATKVGQIESVLTGNMVAGDLLTGHTGYANNPLSKISGTMVDRGTVNITPSTVNQAILGGNHSGLGIVSGDSDLNGNNILKNKNIFGVVGNVIDKKVSRQTFALYVANELKYQSIYLPFKPKYWRFNVALSPSPTTLTAKSYFLEAGENIDYIFDANTSIYKEVYASKNDIFTGSDNAIDVVVDIWDLWTDQGDGTWFNSFGFNANVIDTLYITFIAYSDI